MILTPAKDKIHYRADHLEKNYNHNPHRPGSKPVVWMFENVNQSGNHQYKLGNNQGKQKKPVFSEHIHVNHLTSSVSPDFPLYLASVPTLAKRPTPL